MKVAIFVLSLFAIACVAQNDSFREYQDGPKASFIKYKGKTVNSIQYCDDCGSSGDLLIITFHDGTILTVYAYKYDMKIKQQ